MSDLNVGGPDPGAAGHPGQVPAAPLRGCLGRLQPDPHRPRVRKGVGLPDTILHGLYTMGLVARANAAAAGGDPRALKRLSVQFRGMGAPETEIVVTGTVKSVDGDRVVIDTVAAQGENQTIRNAEAEIAV